MSSKEHAQRLSNALNRTNLVTVRQEHFDANLLRMLCRVQKGMDEKWVAMVRSLLVATEHERGEPHQWSIHICRHYFLMGDEKKLVYGWNVSINSSMMSESLDYIIRILKGEPAKREKNPNNELTEVQLQGTATRNTPNPKGKGAYSIGTGQTFRPPVRR